MLILIWFLPPASAVEVIELVPSDCLRVCVGVCVCVCADPIIGTGMNLDEFNDQGHRSKFKVASLKKSRFFHI